MPSSSLPCENPTGWVWTVLFLRKSYLVGAVHRTVAFRMVRFRSSQQYKKQALFRACFDRQTRAAEKSAALVVIAAFSFLSVLWAWIRGESPSHSQNRFSHTLRNKQIIRTHPRQGITGSDYIALVPLTGIEPVRILLRGILSPLCLPIPPQRRG